jgi:rod shape-determining protein MreD
MRTRNLLKWGLWTLLLLILTGMQAAPAFFSIGGVRPVLLLSAAVSVALLEKNSIAACGYGALAGLIWDVSAGKLFGFYGLAVLLCCAGIAWLAETWLRQSLLNTIWLGAAATFLCGLWEAEFYLFLWGYGTGMVWEVLGRLLLQSVYTGLLSWPVAALVRLIRDRTMGLEESRLHKKD